LFYQLQSPFFRPREGGVDRSFAQIQLPSLHQILGQNLKNHLETTVLLPSLKTSMTRLVRRIPVGQIVPGCSGAQDP
jgi:hypothetical protein